MKLFTPEISWHQKEPIFSIDFCPQSWKLASCGADFTVKIWYIKEKEGNIGLEFLSSLDRHAKPVNVVRFSPNGKLLASAGDDGAIILWKLIEGEKFSAPTIFDDDASNKESWTVHKILRGHIEDVYDLAWSPDSTQLISGSVDNSAIVWDVIKGANLRILTDHKHYVQGVSWDPRNFYIATHSSDRSCRLYNRTNFKCCHNIHKGNMSYEKDGKIVKTKLSRMFMDETMQSFFRRCTFSPDGSFLFLPAGLCDGEKKPGKTTYVFARGHYKRPIKQLIGTKKPTVCVKCSPIVYDLVEKEESNNHTYKQNQYFKVPYRMVYAVASLNSVTIYDTQHDHPIGYCANMHYASLTDLAWSSDGRLLVISSTDGYCSFIKFDENEIGKPIDFNPIEYQETQAKIRRSQLKENLKKEAKKEVKKSEAEMAKTPDLKKVAVVATRSDDVKEAKVQAKIDPKQPTIEKLFTPIRKRKRVSETSPSNKENDQVKDMGEKNMASISPLEKPTTVQNNYTNVIDLSLPKKKDQPIVKPAKRVAVTTLIKFDEDSSKKTTNIIDKNNISKETSPVLTEGTKKPAISPLDKSTIVPINSANIIDLSSPKKKDELNVKPAKRVAVTTLMEFNKDSPKKTKNILDKDNLLKKASPTMTESIEKPSLKSPKRVSVKQNEENDISLNSPVIDKKITVPNASMHIIDLSSPEKKNETAIKPPKRVIVTTLTKFDKDLSEEPMELPKKDKTSVKIARGISAGVTEGKPNQFMEIPKSVSDRQNEGKNNPSSSLSANKTTTAENIPAVVIDLSSTEKMENTTAKTPKSEDAAARKNINKDSFEERIDLTCSGKSSVKTKKEVSSVVTIKPSVKTPKRVSVTTLYTFNKPSNETSQPVNNAKLENIVSPPTEKKPKRVQVTTLCSFPEHSKSDESKRSSTSADKPESS